jgi:nucleoside phosphorylase
MTKQVQCIAIMAAMASELKPVRRALGLSAAATGPGVGCGTEYSGVYAGIAVITVVTTMGLVAAQRATEEVFARHGSAIDHLFVVGIAGAIDPSHHIGEVVIPEVVVDERDGVNRFPVNLSSRRSKGVIYSTDLLFYDSDFVATLNSRNVSLVDMESGAIAAVCERNHCPYTIIRAVSDKVDKHAESYDVFHLANPDGSPRYLAALGYVLKNPSKIPYLIAMGNGAKKAIDASCAELFRNIDRLLSPR